MWKCPTTEMQQLEHLVEARAVTHSVRDDRKRTVKTRYEVTLEQRFARAHPVTVALHRVDLAVVCDVTIWVRKRPRRKCVRAESAMHQCERRLHTVVPQVRIKVTQLWCREHSLVHQRPRREAGEIRAHVSDQLVLDALANDEDLAVKFDSRRTFRVVKHKVTNRRHDCAC